MRPKLLYKAITFDFDLTLADSTQGVIFCARYAFERMKLSIPQNLDIINTIGLPMTEVFYELVKSEGLDRAEEFENIFDETANQVMYDYTVMLSGSTNTINMLYSKGFVLGILSQKPLCQLMPTLQQEKIDHCFTAVIGGDNIKLRKPNPDGIIECLKQFNMEVSDCVYVGDSCTDAMTAKRAEMDFIAVLSGTTTATAFIPFKPCRTINNVNKIISCIQHKL